MITVKQQLKYAQYLTHFLDMKFHVLGISFGIDPFLNVIPIFGSMLGSLMAVYLFAIALQVNVPAKILFQMALNIVIDYLLSVIPILGVFADVMFKANVRNLALLQQHVSHDIVEEGIIVQ